MEKSFLFVLLLISVQSFGQLSPACNSIDFEQIPQTIPEEGISIDSQFVDYGLTFVLDNGEAPKLAEVGEPATAFVTSTGNNDTPKPGQNIGSFILTDDGIVSSSEAFSLNLMFDPPVDRVAGDILDIDTDELFIIQALDESDRIIYQDTIKYGDPNTGDGMATPWEVILTPCEGEIYTVRLIGEKETNGLFGLGVDNLEFCHIDYGIDEDNIVVEVQEAVCGEDNGVLSVNIQGDTGQYIYAIDSIHFQPENSFDQLAAGDYSISIQDLGTCITTTKNVRVGAIPPPYITNIIPTPTTCAQANGSLRIEAKGGSGNFEYSLDGENFQMAPEFQNLEAGSYTVYLRDEDQCLYSESIMLEDSPPIVIEKITISPRGCRTVDGSIDVQLSGGTGQLSVSLNGSTAQTSTAYTGLEKGDYQLVVTDGLGCQLDTLIHVSAIECQVFLPNAFTPNNDGLNDVFLAKTPSQAIVKEYIIYNRWGELLYTLSDFPVSSTDHWWDGTYQGEKVEIGSYFYKITVEFTDGSIIRRDGKVLVVD